MMIHTDLLLHWPFPHFNPLLSGANVQKTSAIFETAYAGLLVSHASLVFSSMVLLLDRFWILYAVYLSTFVLGCICCVSTFDFCCKRFCQEEGEDEESVNSNVSALEMDHGDITSDYAALL